jgi:type I restriction enzyme S subunit
MSFPRYPEYEDSCVEWLGDLPKHWRLIRFKYVFDEKAVVAGNTLLPGSLSFGRVIFKDAEFLHEPTKAAYQEVLSGEFLINPINLNYDLKSLRTALSEINTCVSPAYIVLRLKIPADKNFLKYQLHVFDLFHMKTLGAGVRQTITFGDIGSCYGCLPDFSEQTQIAAFLDYETAKMDALIAQQEKLIEVLKEKRQAVISHAVTKGLDPTAKMKDSGVEWLGEVPEHWSVIPLKFIADVQTGVAKGKDYAEKETVKAPYLRVANVQDGYLDLEDVAFIEIAAKDLNRYLLRYGDVLMNEGGDFDKLGRGCIWKSEIEMCIHQNHVFAVRPHGVSSEWLNTITGSDYAQFYFMSRSKQSTNLASISSSNLMELPIVLPPLNEQLQVMSHINKTITEIDGLLMESKKSSVLLTERRSALISAAVTGQIDVKNFVPAMEAA